MGLVADKTLNRIWKALPAQLGSVVGETATLARPKLVRAWEPGSKRYFAELELAEPRPAKMWMSFSLPLAIASAGHLVMRPRGAVVENIAAETFDGDDLDAMGECVNTFCAAINGALRRHLGDDYRVVFRTGSLTAPDVADAGALTVASAQLELGTLAAGELELVVPDAFFVAAHEGEDEDEDGDDGDEDADADEEEDDDDDDAPAVKAKGAGKRKPKRRGGKRSGRRHEAAGDDGGKLLGGSGERPGADGRDDPASRGGGHREGGATSGRREGAAESEGPLLTPEELAAIREATKAAMVGTTLLVVEHELARERWRAHLADGTDIELVGNKFQLVAACRTRLVDAVVIDADGCPSGGLAALAAIRDCAGAPSRRVVIASKPTRTHLVCCLAGGATDYVTGPADADELRRVLAAG